ncbi:MAG: alpha/beta hydrolase [Betaproteobacteria bacterium]|jgi:pimeloyl-ACP methyl ester carboxylesterase|nr:alpha/beta hydrolase [Betaproteobacteria bacterium]
MTPAQPKPVPSGTPLVIFFHGNSFPASTYTVMLNALRDRGMQVQALEKIGHNPAYPVTSNWPHLVEEVHAFAQPLIAAHTGPVVLVGHSLGGMLSLMLAAQYPHLAHAVVMVDAPAVGGIQAKVLQLSKTFSLNKKFSPGAVSRKRRNAWPSLAEAHAHFAGKKVFARWDPQVLKDYVNHGTHEIHTPEGPKRVLSFDRQIETLIYESVPHNLERLLKKHPLACPVSLVAARHSREMRLAGTDFTQKITKGRICIIDGTHLVPMERPLVTAAAVEAAILNMLSLKVARSPNPDGP